MPIIDIEKRRAYQRKWAKNHRVEKREYYRSLRLKAIEKLGGKCIYCGCNDFKALEFNHKKGGGGEEHKKHNGFDHKLYLDIILERRNDIELTCRVCNSLHYLVELKGLRNGWTITYL